MTGRADWSLELQLQQTEKAAVAAEVKDAIKTAMTYLRSGKNGRIRGGKALIRLLEIARLRASEEAEWDVVCLLQDSHNYATGKTLKYEFEERYRLFQDGTRSKSNANFVGDIIHAGLAHTKDVGERYLSEHPAATPTDLLFYLTALREDAKFINAPEDRPGRYRIVRGRAEMATWVGRVLRDGRVDIEEPRDVVHRIVTSPEALRVLADDDDGQALLRAVELKKRADSLVELRRIAEDPNALEADLQRVLEDKPWIFGGRYVGVADRRRLLPDAEFDIPLIRADGSLHVVEIKRSMKIQAIIKRHRKGWVLASDAQTAIGQAVNYLVSLDESREWVREKYGVDVRRASATVLIGHPAVHPDVPEEQVSEVLRTFNTHHNRVEVITYKELIDSAERSLTF